MGEVSPTAEAPRTVLVYVASDLVGDGLTKLPFLWALRNAYPGARITWLAGKGKSAFAHALAPLVHGLLDEVVENTGTGRSWTELLGRPLRGTPLAGRHFDLIIDGQRQVGTTLLIKRIPHRVFVSGAADFALSDRRPPLKRAKPLSKARRLLDLVELASGDPADTSGQLPPDLRHDSLAAKLLPPGPGYIGLAPGASGTHKCWPLERYLELAQQQLDRGRVPVFLLGPEESGWAAAVAKRLPDALLPLQSEAVAGVGPTPLITIALARRLDAAIANDAGIAHMLAAAACPLVSLFGPTAPEKTAPLARHARVLRAQDYGSDEMSCIPPGAVADVLEEVLLAAGRERGTIEEDDAGEPLFQAVRPAVERRLFGGEVR